MFWCVRVCVLSQMQDVEHVGNDPGEFKNHQLPLARIKKVRDWLAPHAPVVCEARLGARARLTNPPMPPTKP